jgi:hypothetical protein
VKVAGAVLRGGDDSDAILLPDLRAGESNFIHLQVEFTSTSVFGERPHHPSPDFAGVIDLDGRLFGISRDQKQAVILAHEFAEQKLSAANGDDDVPGADVGSSIDHERVAIEYLLARQRIAFDLDEESGDGMRNEVLVQVERSMQIIISRAGKSSPGRFIGRCAGISHLLRNLRQRIFLNHETRPFSSVINPPHQLNGNLLRNCITR